MLSKPPWAFLILVLMTVFAFGAVFAQGTGLVSDDFNRFRFGDDRWTIVNPLETAAVRLVGTNTPDAWLEIDVPGGPSQDAWFTGLNAPRIMQVARNTDFEVEVRFESSVTLEGQSQGILVEQDEGTYLKVYFSEADGQTALLAVGAANYQINQDDPFVSVSVAPLGAGPLWLRLMRTENEWRASYSLDGTVFVDTEPFSQRIAVARVGLYAGVFSFLSDAPPFRLLADYFMNTASPLSDEDAALVEDFFAPVILEQDWLPYDNRIVLNWRTDEPSSAVVEYGATRELESNSLTTSRMTSAHQVELSNLSPDTEYYVRLLLADSSGNEVSTDVMSISTLDAPPTSPVIGLWYGDLQQFGNLGLPQRWVNVLGTVEDTDPDDIVTMTYTLNDGENVPLKVGADRRRLAGSGDFNIEIPIEALVDGENLLIIQAVDRYGNRTGASATLFYSDFNIWSQPYAVDWSQIENVQAAVQVVDGKWMLTPTGLRTAEPGYRRMITLGDISWTDYELVTEFTVNALMPPPSEASEVPDPEPFIGAIMRWTGYHVWDSSQPALGPFPVGAFGRFIWRSAAQSPGGGVELFDSFLNLAATDSSAFQVAVGQSYRMRMRSVTTIDGSSVYAMRIWRADGEEPSWWNVATAIPAGGNSAGSIALVVNRADVTFGDIEVNSLTPEAYIVQTYDNTPPECLVTVAVAAGANLRASPGPDFGLVRTVSGGDSLVVNAQASGADGEVWYRVVNDGAWLRADLVAVNEDCDASELFSVEAIAP